MASKITTPEGFREAIDDLDALLDSLSADQAAGLADEIKGAAYKASKRFSGDDLEDTLIKVDALKNRLRRRWKRQRRSNIGGALLGAAFTGASGVLVKFAAEVPPWAIVVLFFIGVAFGLVAATSLASSTDWRDEVARPVGEVADILAKALAERSEEQRLNSSHLGISRMPSSA